MKNYKCADCGGPATSRRQNAKYCTVCRLARNIQFIGNKTQKCWGCPQKFAPTDRNDMYCARCAPRPSHGETGICALCNTEGPLLKAGLAVCIKCFKDPERRREVSLGLLKKQREQRRQYGDNA